MENKDAGLEGMMRVAGNYKQERERGDKKHLEGAARDAAKCYSKKMSALDWIFRWQRRQRNTRSPYCYKGSFYGGRLDSVEALVTALRKMNSWPWEE